MNYITIDFSSICLCCDRIAPELDKPRDYFTPSGKPLGMTTFPTIEQQNHYILDTALSLLNQSQHSIGVRLILPTAKDLKALINSISSHTNVVSIRSYQERNLIYFDNKYDDCGNELMKGYPKVLPMYPSE
jgi:hypothetical protein